MPRPAVAVVTAVVVLLLARLYSVDAGRVPEVEALVDETKFNKLDQLPDRTSLFTTAASPPRPGASKQFNPVVVRVVGLPRSGSTALYNLARLTVAQADPHLVAGWYKDRHRGTSTTIYQTFQRAQNFSGVIKSHSAGSIQMQSITTAYIFSHRYPVHQVASMLRLERKCKDVAQAVRSCRGLKRGQDGIYQNWRRDGSKPMMDVEYSRVGGNNSTLMLGLVEEMAELFNLRHLVDANRVVEEFLALRPPEGGMFFDGHDPVTLLHPEMRSETASKSTCKYKVVAAFLKGDPVCRKWLKAGGLNTA